jgi:hypothetical protein
MNMGARRNGKLIRKIAKLDRIWRLKGQPEGRLANELAFALGKASRAGMGRRARQVQCESAARLGERSGWELAKA